MKRNLSFLLIPLLGGLFVLLSGCYTQLKTVREEPADNRDYNSSQMSGDTAYTANGDAGQGYSSDYDDGGYHSYVGFNYYYPSYGYGFTYGNPWVSDFYWGYNYYPWYCGTPYVADPAYGYFPHAYYYGSHHYGYAYGGRGRFDGTRTPALNRVAGASQVGTSRGASVIENRYDLPRAARVATPLAGPSAPRTNTSGTNGRSANNVRSGSPRVSSNRNAPLRYSQPPNVSPRPTSPNPGRSSSAGRSSDHSRVNNSPPAQHNIAPRVPSSGGGNRGGGGNSGGGNSGGSSRSGGGRNGGHR